MNDTMPKVSHKGSNARAVSDFNMLALHFRPQTILNILKALHPLCLLRVLCAKNFI